MLPASHSYGWTATSPGVEVVGLAVRASVKPLLPIHQTPWGECDALTGAGMMLVKEGPEEGRDSPARQSQGSSLV